MVLAGIILLVIAAVLNALPLTLFAMLFAGNIGLHYGFLDLLPGAMALNMATSNFITNKGITNGK